MKQVNLDCEGPITKNDNALEISGHFKARCIERAPWFTKARKKKYGGGFELDLPRLCQAIKSSKEVKRPNTISRLIKYGHKTKYYHFDKTGLKNQVIFVVEGNLLVTLYLYRYSWMVKI